MKQHRLALERGNTLVSQFITSLPSTGDWYEDAQKSLASDSVVEKVILHRLRKKFERPDKNRANTLHEEALHRFVTSDERLGSLDLFEIKKIAYRIRPLIAKWLEGIYFDVEDAWFGPGESFNSSGGYTSAVSKVRTFPYTVTASCAEDFFHIIWSNRQWRRFLCYRIRKDGLKKSFAEALRADRGLDFVIEHGYFEIVNGSRFASVPKDNDNRRGINVEPLGNLVCQRIDGLAIRRRLAAIGNSIGHGNFDPSSSSFDIKHGDGQKRQGDILRTRGCGITTVDLASASDSISLKLCALVLPSFLLKRLMRHRCDVVCHSDGNGQWLNMMSSMGNGFTFELLTLIVLAIGRYHDPKASAYGDDLIVSSGTYPSVRLSLEQAGFIVNHKKTFHHGFLRESCGVFTWFGNEFEAYDFKWMESMVDLTIVCNKLYRLLCSPFLMKWRNKIRRLWTRLVRLVDIQYRAPIWGGLDTFVFDPAVPLKTSCNSRFLAKNLQYDPHCIVKRFVLEQVTRTKSSIRSFDAELVSYFKSMMPVAHGRRGDLRLTSEHLLVTDGHWCQLSNLYALYEIDMSSR